jgi:hypothetical protein
LKQRHLVRCRALANITNAKSKRETPTITDIPDVTKKGASAGELASKGAADLTGSLSGAGALSSPEKLVGPTGAQQEQEARHAEDSEIDEKVQRILRAFEGIWVNSIGEVCKDDDIPYQLDVPERTPMLALDTLDTLPDMSAPAF